MIIYFVAYLISFAIVLIVQRVKRLKVEECPAMKLEKSGIVFNSKKRHKLKIYGAKVMQVANSVYLKKDNRLVQLVNVDEIFLEKDYLYFKALGETKLRFDCEKIYKYFNLKIKSKKIDVEKFKKLAIIDIKNHIFDLKNAKFLKIYVKILKKILNIHIEEEKITIKQNKYKIPFSVLYKSKGVKKRINVNC